MSERLERHAFTIVETLFTIAIIAVLGAILFPYLNDAREEANRVSAKTALSRIELEAKLFYYDTSRMPPPIDPDEDFWSDRIADPYGLAFTNDGERLERYGYVFSYERISDTRVLLVAEPVVPGLTGSISLLFDVRAGVSEFETTVTEAPTPGADEMRKAAFQEVQADTLQLIGETIVDRGDADTASETLSYLGSNEALLASLIVVDADSDGTVRIEEILDADEAVVSPRFTELLRSRLALGAGSEDVASLPGVSIAEVEGDLSEAISADAFRLLTERLSTRDEADGGLVAKLGVVETAPSRTRQSILSAYQRQVDAQAGKSFDDADAQTLQAIAEVLKYDDRP